MTYKKAQDILPSHIIEEVQKYLDGGLIYFPKKTERRKWGSANGTQVALHERNVEIKTLFTQGQSLEALSRRFCLSEDSIRKIVKNTDFSESQSVSRVGLVGKNRYK